MDIWNDIGSDNEDEWEMGDDLLECDNGDPEFDSLPNITEDVGTDNQLFKFSVRFSNKSIQDKDTWLNEIQPEFDELCRYMCKKFSYSVENTIQDEVVEDSIDIDSGFTDDTDIIETLDDNITNNSIVFEDEILKEDQDAENNIIGLNNYHIQAYWNVKARIRCSTLISNLNVTNWRGIEISPAINAGALEAYTQKRDSRVAGPWTENGKKYMGEDILDSESGIDGGPLRRWQLDLYGVVVHSTPINRRVLYIYDKKGGRGKSRFMKFMRFKHGDDDCEGGNIFGSVMDGTIGQITSTLCNKIRAKKIYMYDACRSKKTIEAWRAVYSVIEQLANGWVQSSLYGGVNVQNELLCAPPHIVIYANTPPKFTELSGDRWFVYTIETDPENPDPVNDRLMPYIDKKGKVWAEPIESILDTISDSEEDEELDFEANEMSKEEQEFLEMEFEKEFVEEKVEEVKEVVDVGVVTFS